MASGYDVQVYFTKACPGTGAIKVKSMAGFISKPEVAPDYSSRDRPQFRVRGNHPIPGRIPILIALVPMAVFCARADLMQSCSVEVLGHRVRGTKVSLTKSDFQGRLFEVEMGPPQTAIVIPTQINLKSPGWSSDPIPDHPSLPQTQASQRAKSSNLG